MILFTPDCYILIFGISAHSQSQGVTKLKTLPSLIGLVALLLTSASAHAETKEYKLGETVVTVEKTDKGPGPIFINVHENEQTSVMAAKSVMEKSGGTLIELHHGGERNVTFQIEGKSYTFDPNRIFLNKGIVPTLEKLGKSSPEAVTFVAYFGAAILLHDIKFDDLRKRTIIALHNNTDGGGLTINEYESGASRKEAAKVFVNPKKDPDDFFLVTNKRAYDQLVAKGFNVVLQKSPPPTNDGSLSVLCDVVCSLYINVEAQNGHLDEQIAMLKAAVALK